MIVEKHQDIDPIKDRFTWAASLISPCKSDHILEIGCGTGILIEQLATSLTNGWIFGIDKSASMIRAAEQRNKRAIEKGVVQFLMQDYSTSSLDHLFDKAVAFNVSGFWEKPTTYLPLLKMHLKPNGRFYLFCQPPFDKTHALAQKAEAVLTTYGFFIEKVYIQAFEPAPAFCIICVPE